MTLRGEHLLRNAGLPPSEWVFPWTESPDASGLVVLGGDLEISTLIEAYCSGLFPMPVGRKRLGWFSPDPRGVLEVEQFVVSRSLRRSRKNFRIAVDTAFDEVVDRCGDPSRPNGWINTQIRDAYGALHRAGFAHSIETYNSQDQLVGGLYGVSIGSFFAGESMFHAETDASKVALSGLVDILAAAPAALLDVQWVTPHLSSLGASTLERDVYLDRVARSTAQAHGQIWNDVENKTLSSD